jgi:hypothetical protein
VKSIRLLIFSSRKDELIEYALAIRPQYDRVGSTNAISLSIKAGAVNMSRDGPFRFDFAAIGAALMRLSPDGDRNAHQEETRPAGNPVPAVRGDGPTRHHAVHVRMTQ